MGHDARALELGECLEHVLLIELEEPSGVSDGIRSIPGSDELEQSPRRP